MGGKMGKRPTDAHRLTFSMLVGVGIRLPLALAGYCQGAVAGGAGHEAEVQDESLTWVRQRAHLMPTI